MIASYFRAVKEASSLMRSKNRQSPVAKRDTVDGSKPRAAPKAAAQENK